MCSLIVTCICHYPISWVDPISCWTLLIDFYFARLTSTLLSSCSCTISLKYLTIHAIFRFFKVWKIIFPACKYKNSICLDWNVRMFDFLSISYINKCGISEQFKNTEKFLNSQQKITIKCIMNPSCFWHSGLCCIYDWTSPGWIHNIHNLYLACLHQWMPTRSRTTAFINCAAFTQKGKIPALTKYNSYRTQRQHFDIAFPQNASIKLVFLWIGMSECLIF